MTPHKMPVNQIRNKRLKALHPASNNRNGLGHNGVCWNKFEPPFSLTLGTNIAVFKLESLLLIINEIYKGNELSTVLEIPFPCRNTVFLRL